MENKIIDVVSLTKKYSSGKSLALDHINLSINSDQFLVCLVQMVLVKAHLLISYLD